MKKIIVFIILCLTIIIAAEVYSDSLKPTAMDIPGYVTPEANEVFIGRGCIEIPLKKIALVKFKGKYCAVKFTRFWHEQDKNGNFSRYASYNVYYQKDGSADFAKPNAVYREGQASKLPLRGPMHQILWQPGKPFIQCGSLKLCWEYQGFLCFCEGDIMPGDYGVEIAPTPWESFSEIDVRHPNIKWFKYDKARESMTIPINKLWGH